MRSSSSHILFEQDEVNLKIVFKVSKAIITDEINEMVPSHTYQPIATKHDFWNINAMCFTVRLVGSNTNIQILHMSCKSLTQDVLILQCMITRDANFIDVSPPLSAEVARADLLAMLIQPDYGGNNCFTACSPLIPSSSREN